MNAAKAKKVIQQLKLVAGRDPHLSINELRVIVALERAIARMERSELLAEHLIFKGGLILLKLYHSGRFTRDVDALALSISKTDLSNLVSMALKIDLEDGLWFGDVQVHDLQEQGQYGAYRFDCAFQIGEPDNSKIHKLPRIHIDIAFSDRLTSNPVKVDMPSLLPYETPVSWRVYPLEHIVAEKLETLIKRGSSNSRAKDVYDLAFLIPLCDDDMKLRHAILETFRNRGTSFPSTLVKAVESYDVTVFKTAWTSVRVFENKPEFESIWRKLVSKLTRLDQLLK